MPLVYRLHRSLALGTVGGWILALVAVVWTLDCFVGLYLTLPAGGRRADGHAGLWWRRWRPAWTLRWQAGRYKRFYDLHRAGGLWAWLLLLAMAWSSVALAWPAAWRLPTHAVFAHQTDEFALPVLKTPRLRPALDWAQARERGRQLVRTLPIQVLREDWMFYDAQRGLFRHAVVSERDAGDRYSRTLVWFDGDSGEVRGHWLPTGTAAADTQWTWLTRLHMAAAGGVAVKVVLTALGAVVALLSATGLWLWGRRVLKR